MEHVPNARIKFSVYSATPAQQLNKWAAVRKFKQAIEMTGNETIGYTTQLGGSKLQRIYLCQTSIPLMRLESFGKPCCGGLGDPWLLAKG